MTLHEAIEKVLVKNKKAMTTDEIAMELNRNKWYQKKDKSEISAFQIHGRTRNYSHLFGRNGSTVMLKDNKKEITLKKTNEIQKKNDK